MVRTDVSSTNYRFKTVDFVYQHPITSHSSLGVYVNKFKKKKRVGERTVYGGEVGVGDVTYILTRLPHLKCIRLGSVRSSHLPFKMH